MSNVQTNFEEAFEQVKECDAGSYIEMRCMLAAPRNIPEVFQAVSVLWNL
jgi:hypothetical protein